MGKKTEAKTYRSEIAASIHKTMSAAQEAGVIDKQTMREFDDACLKPVEPIPPEQIAACTSAVSRNLAGRRFGC